MVEYVSALALIGLAIVAAVLATEQAAKNRASTSKYSIDGAKGMVACDPNQPLLNTDSSSTECY